MPTIRVIFILNVHTKFLSFAYTSSHPFCQPHQCNSRSLGFEQGQGCTPNMRAQVKKQCRMLLLLGFFSGVELPGYNEWLSMSEFLSLKRKGILWKVSEETEQAPPLKIRDEKAARLKKKPYNNNKKANNKKKHKPNTPIKTYQTHAHTQNNQ